MRKLILDKIDDLRASPIGWDRYVTMRWSKQYLVPNEGLRYFSSKKERHNEAQNAILLNKTTRKDFDTLSDLELLECYTTMIRTASKQM